MIRMPHMIDTVPESLAVETPPEDRGEPTLELRHLHRFFGRLKAVNNVSFKAIFPPV